MRVGTTFLRRWPLAVAVATGLALAPAVPAVATTPRIPGLPGVPSLPNPTSVVPGLPDLGAKLPGLGAGLPGSASKAPSIPDAPGTSGEASDGSGPKVEECTYRSGYRTREEARTCIFGPGYDRPGVIRARPVGNTTWLYSFGGTVVTNDSTIEDNLVDVGAAKDNNGYVSLDEVVAAKPDAILQDHTHFDQQHNAPELASRTGAPLVTDLGGCLWTKETAIEKSIDPSTIHCDLIRDAEGRPFFMPDTLAAPWAGQGVLFTPFGAKGYPERPIPGLDTMAVALKHSPSFTDRPFPGRVSGPNIDPVRNLNDILKRYKNASPQQIAENIYSTYAPFDLEGSNVGWLIEYKGFKVFDHGSTGDSFGLEPGAKAIGAALRTLGDDGRVDVEVGSIAEVTYLTNGHYFQDQKDYSKDIAAKLFFPSHHYNWYPFWLTNPAAVYWPGMKKTWADGEKEAPGKFPRLCYLTERNYATLWTFDVKDWQGDRIGKAKPVVGPGCYTG